MSTKQQPRDFGARLRNGIADDQGLLTARSELNGLAFQRRNSRQDLSARLDAGRPVGDHELA
jgi:hypothetical protein